MAEPKRETQANLFRRRDCCRVAGAKPIHAKKLFRAYVCCFADAKHIRVHALLVVSFSVPKFVVSQMRSIFVHTFVLVVSFSVPTFKFLVSQTRSIFVRTLFVLL